MWVPASCMERSGDSFSSFHLSPDLAKHVEEMTDADIGDPSLLELLADVEVGSIEVSLHTVGKGESAGKDTESVAGLTKRKVTGGEAEERPSKKPDLGDRPEVEARREPLTDPGAMEMIPFF